jgi:hypothetical protein
LLIILSFTKPGKWDVWQNDSGIAFFDYRWKGFKMLYLFTSGTIKTAYYHGPLRNTNALTCEVKYKQSLNDAFSASGIAGDGKVYFSSEIGIICVIKVGHC